VEGFAEGAFKPESLETKPEAHQKTCQQEGKQSLHHLRLDLSNNQ
jgi:hypothetical protein